AFDRALAAEPAQVPDQVGLRGDLEHHFRTSHAPHRSAGKRLVAKDFLAVSDDDRVVFDVQSAVAQRLAQIRKFFRLFAVLETLRRIRGLPDAAVDLALQPQLRIVDDERATDENVEERGDVFAVDTL